MKWLGSVFCIAAMLPIRWAVAENKVTLEFTVEFRGDVSRLLSYHSPHGFTYSDLGWGHGEKLTVVPDILPLGFEGSMTGRFKTYPHPYTYADSLQVVASDVAIWGPWIPFLTTGKGRIGIEGRSQSFSAHQVPAQVWLLQAAYKGLRLDAEWYGQAFTNVIEVTDGTTVWAPQKYVAGMIEFAHGHYAINIGMRWWYTDDPTNPRMHGLSLRQLWLAAVSRVDIEGQQIHMTAAVERWNDVTVPRVSLTTVLARMGF